MRVKSSGKKRPGPGRPKVGPSVSIRINPDQLQQLDKLAEAHGTTRTALIQIAVARLVKEGL